MEETKPVKLYKSVSETIEKNIHLLPHNIQEEYKKIPSHILEMDEAHLRRECKITAGDERIRVALWREMQYAFSTGNKFGMNKLVAGVSTIAYMNRVVRNHYKLAWFLCPIIAYDNQAEALLQCAIHRYQEMLDMDIMVDVKVMTGIDEKSGRATGYKLVKQVDPKRAGLLLNVIRNLEDRVKGTPVSRNLIVSETNTGERSIRDVTDMGELDKKLKELEEKLANAPRVLPNQVIQEVEYKEIDTKENE